MFVSSTFQLVGLLEPGCLGLSTLGIWGPVTLYGGAHKVLLNVLGISLLELP